VVRELDRGLIRRVSEGVQSDPVDGRHLAAVEDRFRLAPHLEDIGLDVKRRELRGAGKEWREFLHRTASGRQVQADLLQSLAHGRVKQ